MRSIAAVLILVAVGLALSAWSIRMRGRRWRGLDPPAVQDDASPRDEAQALMSDLATDADIRKGAGGV